VFRPCFLENGNVRVGILLERQEDAAYTGAVLGARGPLSLLYRGEVVWNKTRKLEPWPAAPALIQWAP
jgi:hypothetical protein